MKQHSSEAPRGASILRLGIFVLFSAVFTTLHGQAAGDWYTVNTQGVNPEQRHESAFVRVGNLFYLLGGRGNTTIQVYNPSTKSWSNTGTKLDNIHHFQARAFEGKIYLIGALSGNYPNEKPLANVLIYDPQQDALLTGATIPTARRRGSSGVAMYNGKFYIVAGNRNGHSAFLDNSSTPANVAWVDKYDPKTNTWTVLPNAPHARDHFFAEVIGNKLYVAGGRRSKNGAPAGTWSDTELAVDVFNLVTEQWLSGSDLPDPLPTARAGAATAVLNSELLVIGGEIDNNPPNDLALPHTEILNPTSGDWRRDADLGLQRHGTQAIVYDGDVYVAAGSKTKGGSDIGANEAFLEALSFDGTPDKSYPNWTKIGKSPQAKAEHGLITYGGEYYFIHGFKQNIAFANTVEKYNPATNTWTPLTPMPAGEGVTHNGVALVNDAIWVVGGRLGNHPGPVTNETWIYNIPGNSWSAGPDLPIPAGGGGLALLGSELHFVGGFEPDAKCDIATHLVYDLEDPSTGWQDRTAVSPMPEARNHFSTVTYDGKLYAVGGQFGHDGCQGGLDLKFLHVYDPVTDKWTRLADLPGVQSHAEPSTFVHNDKILIVGGDNSTGKYVWEYNIATNNWVTLNSMQLPDKLLAPGVRVYIDKMIVMNGGQPGTASPIDDVMVKDFTPATNPSLSFNPKVLNVNLDGNQVAKREVILSNLFGEETTPFNLNTGSLPSWLSVTRSHALARQSATEVDLTVSAAGLAEGVYSFTLEASAQGYNKAQLAVKLTVGKPTTPPPPPPPPTNNFSVYLEAECGTLGSNWVTKNSAQAAGGNYVVLADGIDRSLDTPPANSVANIVSYTVQVPQQGNYKLFARILAPNDDSDSFWVRVNGGQWIKWWQGLGTGANYAWREVLNSPFTLPAGTVKIEVTYREPGTQLDKLYLTATATTPSGLGGEAAACSAPPPPPPPPTDDAFSSYLEAECGTIGSNWTVGSDVAASQDKYVVLKSGFNPTFNSPPADVAANRIRLNVNLPKAGNYRLFGRIKAPNGESDSYWVRINGGQWIKWWQGTLTGNTFDWREVINSPFALPAGSVNIDVAYREPGTQLDKLFLTNTTDVPAGEGGVAAACGTAPPPPPPPPTDPSVAIRINAGGPTVQHNGQEFVADTYFNQGNPYSNPSATVPTIYKTERSSPQPYQYTYSVPVPNGEYLVRLHFAEIYHGAADGGTGGIGKRVFDVSLENSKILDNYDITADVGTQTATVKEFPVTVQDGTVSLFFDASRIEGGVDQPKLSALEVLSQGEVTEPDPDPEPNPVTAFWAEAECATGGSQWTYLNRSSASEGRYAVFNSGGNLGVPTTYGGASQLSWTVDLAQAGTYHLFLRMHAPNPSSNSFWVSVDNKPWIKFWRNAQGVDILTSDFEWKKVLDDGFDVSFALAPGQHTIRVAPREPGTELDKIHLSTSATPPTGNGAAAPACSIQSSAAAPAASRTADALKLPSIDDLRLFPNPATTELNYAMESTRPGIYQLQVTDFTGRLLQQRTLEAQVADETLSGSLDVADWPAGTYRLRVIDGEGGAVMLRSFIKLR